MRRNPRSCFHIAILSISNLQCLPKRSLIPSYLFLTRNQKQARRNRWGMTPRGSGGAPTVHAGNTPVDHSQGDPSLDKMPKQGASSQEVVKPTKGILHPSKSPCPRPTVAAWCSNSCDFLNIISRIAPLLTPVEWVKRTWACTCCW